MDSGNGVTTDVPAPVGMDSGNGVTTDVPAPVGMDSGNGVTTDVPAPVGMDPGNRVAPTEQPTIQSTKQTMMGPTVCPTGSHRQQPQGESDRQQSDGEPDRQQARGDSRQTRTDLGRQTYRDEVIDRPNGADPSLPETRNGRCSLPDPAFQIKNEAKEVGKLTLKNSKAARSYVQDLVQSAKSISLGDIMVVHPEIAANIAADWMPEIDWKASETWMPTVTASARRRRLANADEVQAWTKEFVKHLPPHLRKGPCYKVLKFKSIGSNAEELTTHDIRTLFDCENPDDLPHVLKHVHPELASNMSPEQLDKLPEEVRAHLAKMLTKLLNVNPSPHSGSSEGRPSNSSAGSATSGSIIVVVTVVVLAVALIAVIVFTPAGKFLER